MAWRTHRSATLESLVQWNRLKQPHYPVTKRNLPWTGFKEFRCAQATLAGIELIRMLRKGQMRCQAGMSKTPAEFFYELAG